MSRIPAILIAAVCVNVFQACGAAITWLEVDPTLLPAGTATLVTATTTGPRFYTTPDPPVFRVGITQNGDPIVQVDPVSVSQTRLTFRVPALDAGFYGFRVRVQDPISLLWTTVYQSSDRFLRVDADTEARRVFNTFDLLQPGYQPHPREFLTTTQCVARGTVAGTRSMGQHVDDGAGALNQRWTRDFEYDGEGACGIEFGFDCRLDGYSMFNFSIPFEMVFDLPTQVSAGQTLRFSPRILRYVGGDQVSSGHSLDFSTLHRLFINVPYDTLPALDISMEQLPDKLQVSGTVPIASWAEFGFGPLDIGWPFDDGQATYNGVTLKLGGHKDYTTSGQAVTVSQGSRTISTEEVRLTDLWSTAGDLILFLAEAPIPYVQQAAMGLAAAHVEFQQTFNMVVRSRDLVCVDTPQLLEFEMTAPALTGAWHVQRDLSFQVAGKLWASYIYELGAGFVFDMPFIDPVPIPSSGPWSLTPVYTAALPQAEVFTVHCTIDTILNVIASNDWAVAYAPPTVTGAVHLANFTPLQATNERVRISNLVFTAPTLPEATGTVQTNNTYALKPGSELALVLITNPPLAGRIALNPPPVDGGYPTGTVVAVTAQAEGGYEFTGWTGDVVGTANPTAVTMDKVQWLTANFRSTSVGPPAEVLAWGANDTGQTEVPTVSSNAVAVAAGHGFSAALMPDGTVQSWGNWMYAETNVPVGLSNVAAIASGWSHTLALKSDGTVVGWGAGTTVGSPPERGQAIIPAGLSGIVAVAGGSTHSLALDGRGRVVAWGGRNVGETNVPAGTSNVVAIAAGADYSLALKGDGKVIGWGQSGYGAAAPPGSLNNVVAIAAGWFHALGLHRDGTVTAWGAGTSNSGTFPHFGQSMVPAGLSDVIGIAAGDTFSLALKRDGTVAAWGMYYGPGGYVQMTPPMGLSNVTAIAAGGSHCVALVNGRGPQTRLSSPTRGAGIFSVSTMAQRGKAYFLEYKNSLADPAWTMMPAIYGEGLSARLSDSSAAPSSRYYRVRCY